eukprot:scaffold42846_cov27-Tisochrysis_lutea.AAC.2
MGRGSPHPARRQGVWAPSANPHMHVSWTPRATIGARASRGGRGGRELQGRHVAETDPATTHTGRGECAGAPARQQRRAPRR